MEMKYYEFNKLDYYALIRANSNSDAAGCYIKNVAYGQEDYKEVLESAEQVSEAVAFNKIKQSFEWGLGMRGVQELYTSFEIDFRAKSLMMEGSQVLLVDGSLL